MRSKSSIAPSMRPAIAGLNNFAGVRKEIRCCTSGLLRCSANSTARKVCQSAHYRKRLRMIRVTFFTPQDKNHKFPFRNQRFPMGREAVCKDRHRSWHQPAIVWRRIRTTSGVPTCCKSVADPCQTCVPDRKYSARHVRWARRTSPGLRK